MDASNKTPMIVTPERPSTEIPATYAAIPTGLLAAIVESSDDAIVSKDLNGRITSWNGAATRILGYTAEEMIGESILRLVPAHLHDDERRIIENIKAGKRIEHFETVRLAKDGQLREVSLTISPVRDESGTIIGASKILRDISQRKRMEISLVQAEKIAATGRMAATIAHEINNPLEAVVNLLYLAKLKATDREQMEYLSAAESEVGRVSHIAKQTLGFYRENAAAVRESLAGLTAEAVRVYEPKLRSGNIQLQTHFESHREIEMRKGEMMQVISNLVANSIYAMPNGGRLTISVVDAAEPRDGVLLTLEDTGVGIPEKNLARIFDAFFSTRTNIGTGIGLFVARQFVEGHGGTLSVESSTHAERHGTKMVIFLPADGPHPG